ncbi:hypothetical protein KY284_033808 [Solanum tuberosum]|nr:hypothetical protein KY284_033808 [Solanum tuberosum]
MSKFGAYSIALVLTLNILFFTMVSSTNVPCPPPPHPKPHYPTPSTPSSKGSSPTKTKCCSLIEGLVDLDAAVCLCTALKANLLGINLNIPLSLNLLLNNCGKYAPKNFQCA